MEINTEIVAIAHDCIPLLCSPIGKKSYMTRVVNEKAAEVANSLDFLERMDDANTAFSLARTCFRTYRMNFFSEQSRLRAR